MTASCGRCSTDAAHVGCWASWNEVSSSCSRSSCYTSATYSCSDSRCTTTPVCTSPSSDPHFACQNNTCVSLPGCSTSSGGCTSAGGSCGTTTPTPTTTSCQAGQIGSYCDFNSDCCSGFCDSTTGYCATTPTTPTPTTPTPTTPTTTSAPTYTITGRVFIDTNQNGAKDTGESYWPLDAVTKEGATVNLSGRRTRSDTTSRLGEYSFSNSPAGDYTVTLVVPTGYRTTTTNPRSVTLGPSSTVNFGVILASVTPTPTSIPTPTNTPTPTSAPTYTITGNIFIDTNNNGIKDTGESCYVGNIPSIKYGTNSELSVTNFTSTAGCNTYSITTATRCHNISMVSPQGYKITGWSGSDSTHTSLNQTSSTAYVCGF